MLSYLLELTICWTVLYALYALALREETFFKVNRAYLLFTLLGGIFILLLEWPTASSNAAENAVVYLQTVVIGGMKAVEISAQQTQISSSIGLTDVLLWLYFGGVLIFGMRFLYGLFQIRKLYFTSEKRIYQGTKLVLIPKVQMPFSFLNALFIPQDFNLEESDNQKIIEHERAHLRQRHTIDVLFLEVLSILFWCIPPIYFFKKSLRQIHEYLADAEVLKNTQKKQYGLLLLRQSHQGRMCLSLANHFNQSQLKKRIMMMTKKPSNSRALWKYLAVLPLCFLLVFAFANREEKSEFSIFSFSQNDFDQVTVKSEIRKLYDTVNEVLVEDKKATFGKLEARFNELMVEHPKHREEIMFIATETANEVGIPVALVNVKQEGIELPELICLSNFGDPICKDADEMPRFPGCEEKTVEERDDCAQYEMLMFIFDNIKYPQEARDKNVKGMVVTRFVVGADGKIRNAKIVRKIGSGCDEAVLEIVAQMPDWIPGKKDGKNVAVEFNLPVKFKLEDDAVEEKPNLLASLEAQEPLELQNFSISPNPNDGNFKIHFEGEKMPLSLLVFNLKGEILYNKDLTHFSGNFDETISVETSSETLLVTVTNKKDDRVFWQKVIIQK